MAQYGEPALLAAEGLVTLISLDTEWSVLKTDDQIHKRGVEVTH